MNILFTLPDLHFGGSSNLLAQNIKEISINHKVHLIYFGPNETMMDTFVSFGVIPERISYNSFGDFKSAVTNLRNFIIEKNIDLVHSNLFLDKLIVASACNSLNILKVATIHSAQSYQGKTLKRKVLYSIENYLHKYKFEKTIVVSKAAYNYANSSRGIPNDKLELLLNGIAKVPRHHIPNKFFGSDTTVFGTACRFHTIKGLHRLIDVFHGLINRGWNLKLFLIGDGGEKESLKSKINKYNINSSIHITGFTNNVPQYLNQIDYYVNSSYTEAMPVSVLEALSLGKPVIASNVGGLKEIVTDNYNGILVDFEDVDGTILKIEKFLILGKNQYNVLANNAENDFDKRFSSQVFTNSLLKIYIDNI